MKEAPVRHVNAPNAGLEHAAIIGGHDERGAAWCSVCDQPVWKQCPRCLQQMETRICGALSRTDNETEVCSACGRDEGMKQFLLAGWCEPQSSWPLIGG